MLLLLFLVKGISGIHAASANLSLAPSAKTVTVGQTFSVEIRLNSGGESVNTVTANISYSPDKLRAISIDTSGSFVTIWFENNIATASGQIKLTGSVPSPGVSGSTLLFARINFSALAEGTASASFDTTSAVYRNSDNTDILSSTQNGSYTVAALTPTATPTPVPTAVTSLPTVTSAPVPTTASRQLPNVGVNWPSEALLALAVLLIVSGGMLVRFL